MLMIIVVALNWLLNMALAAILIILAAKMNGKT